MKKIKIVQYFIIAAAAAAMLSGCSSEKPDETAPASESTSAEETHAITEIGEGIVENMNVETRPIAEGDDYAINKINNRSPEDSLPGGYALQSYTEEQQGKFFANGKSKIIIRAYNYKEDLQELAIWADQACAITKIANITSACDTNYSEPQNVTVLGFDAIKYDYDIVQYEFVPDENDPEKEVKSPIGTYKGIAYYFYSDQDAYVIMFDTAEEDWEEQSAAFDEFINDLEITKTEY